MKLKLLPKFIISLCAVGLALTIAISLFSYGTSKTYLEELYAERVMTNSNAIAAMLDVDDVKTIIAPGGDKTPEYREMYALLNKLKRDGGISFLSLVIPDEDSVCFYIDALIEGDDPAQQLPYGTDVPYAEAANPDDPADYQKYITVWENFAQNKGVDHPLVTDNDYGYNYTGVSAILDENGQAIAEIQYILDMSEVRAYLNSFLFDMLFISFAIIAVIILVYICFVRNIVTAPIGRLTAFTQRITETSTFENQHIDIKTGDEIESLSESFNFMLAELENYIANLSRATAEKERIGAELDVAKHIQSSTLPCIFPAFPDIPEFDIFASMTPAKEVGGDFYDFFLIDDDHLAMVIADVSGKGVPAAMFMMISKTLIKSAAQNCLSPKSILEHVNNQLCENNEADMFVTVWLGILQISTGKVVCANAGHEYPAIMRKGGDFELFKDRHGFVLAGMEGARYRQYELQLNAGDRLFVYTDGVPEATNADNTLFGTQRMIQSLNSAKGSSCEAMLHAVHADVDAFAGDAPQFDDITMLCVEMRDTGPAWQRLCVAPTLDSLPEVTAFIEQQLEAADAPMRAIAQINVAVDEIFSNIAHYSDASAAHIELRVSGNQIRIRFIDNGHPYDPTAAPDPDTTLSAEERGIGGLGIFMVKKTMDCVKYDFVGGRNVLSIAKSW